MTSYVITRIRFVRHTKFGPLRRWEAVEPGSWQPTGVWVDRDGEMLVEFEREETVTTGMWWWRRTNVIKVTRLVSEGDVQFSTFHFPRD